MLVMATFRMALRLMLSLWANLLLMLSRHILSGVVDRAADIILPRVDLWVLLRCQPTVVCNWRVDVALTILSVVRNSALLIHGTIVHRPHCESLWLAVIDRSELSAVSARRIPMTDLVCRR